MFLNELCHVDGERYGRLFQARGPATANTRSPIVERRVVLMTKYENSLFLTSVSSLVATTLFRLIRTQYPISCPSCYPIHL